MRVGLGQLGSSGKYMDQAVDAVLANWLAEVLESGGGIYAVTDVSGCNPTHV